MYSKRDSLVGNANSSGIIGTQIKPQLASVFVGFDSLLLVFLMNFWRLSIFDSRIVHILGALDKNTAKIFTKGFTKMQDFYQEFQVFPLGNTNQRFQHFFKARGF